MVEPKLKKLDSCPYGGGELQVMSDGAKSLVRVDLRIHLRHDRQHRRDVRENQIEVNPGKRANDVEYNLCDARCLWKQKVILKVHHG